MADEEATANKIPVTINVTQHTAFKLPYASKLNRGTKGKMEEGKMENKESKMAAKRLVTLPMMHSAVHPPAWWYENLVRADEINYKKTQHDRELNTNFSTENKAENYKEQKNKN